MPKIFWVNFSQFRGLFKVFAENKAGWGEVSPAAPAIEMCV